MEILEFSSNLEDYDPKGKNVCSEIVVNVKTQYSAVSQNVHCHLYCYCNNGKL